MVVLLKLLQLASAGALVRDMDLGAPVHDSRRLEILAEGLPLHGGVQLAIDTTLVSTLHCDGSAVAAPLRLTVLFAEARRRKERTPELVGPRRRARLVVLAGEVAGRWSDETCRFLSLSRKLRPTVNHIC